MGASIGVVVLDPATSQQREGRIFVEGSTDEANEDVAEETLKWADSAMYDAKRHGGGIRIVRYETTAG